MSNGKDIDVINFDDVYNDIVYLLQEQEEGSDEESSDDNINYRNKDEERIKLENNTKNKLSQQTVKTINNNEKEIDKIIDKLQTNNVLYNGSGINLSKIKSRSTQRHRSL